MKASYSERDYGFGQRMLKLRKGIGLTQGRLGKLLGMTGRAVSEWETGSSYPTAAHLKEVIALAVQHQVWPKGGEAEEIRALWKAAHPKTLLDEYWLSALLALPSSPAGLNAPEPSTVTGMPVMVCPGNLRPEEHAEAPPTIQNLPFPPNPFFTGRDTELLRITQLFEQSARIAITQPISVSGLGGLAKHSLPSNMHIAAIPTSTAASSGSMPQTKPAWRPVISPWPAS